MASVGKALQGSEQCRWIEFKIQANEGGVERLWIRKLLIPERYLKKGENPTLHVIRGWTKQEDGKVERVPRANCPTTDKACRNGPRRNTKIVDRIRGLSN